jgi:hypothetical protein
MRAARSRRLKGDGVITVISRDKNDWRSGRPITFGRSRKSPTDRNMCALKLTPKSGNTSTREGRVGENASMASHGSRFKSLGALSPLALDSACALLTVKRA